MNIKDCLYRYIQEGNNKRLDAIAKKLSVDTFGEQSSSMWKIHKICEALMQNEKAINTVLEKISDEDIITIDNLKKIVFGNKNISEKSKKILEEWGFIYFDDIPDDLWYLLWNRWKNEAQLIMEDFIKPYYPSIFLNYMRFLGLGKDKGEINADNCKSFKKIIDNLYKDDVKNIADFYIDFSIRNNIVQLQPNSKSLKVKETICLESLEEQLRFITYFYSEFFGEKSTVDGIEVLKYIFKFQEKEENWISQLILNNNISDESIIKLLEKLGLIYLSKQEIGDYLQLTPEGWFIANGKYPEFWGYKNIFIASDFRAFTFYNYNPFAIYDMNLLFDIKDEEFLIIYSLENRYKNLEEFKTDENIKERLKASCNMEKIIEII